MNETFCSLRYILNDEDYKIVIPEDEYNSITYKHKKEIIEILNLQNRVVLLKVGEIVCATEMIICNRHLDFPFINKFIEKCIKLSDYQITPNMKKIFLSRENVDTLVPDKRPITNIIEFTNQFIDNNINIYSIIPEKLKLVDQVAIINNADNVISLIGAGCENIMFTKNVCKFHILYPNQIKIKIWAQCYKNQYYNSLKKCNLHIIGSVDHNIKKKGTDVYNWPWIIDLNKIKKIGIF